MIETSEGKILKVKLKQNLRLFSRADHVLPFYGKGTVIEIPAALAKELLTAKHVEEAPNEAKEKFEELFHETKSSPKFEGKQAGLTEDEVNVLIEEALDRQKKALAEEFSKQLQDALKKR